MVSYFVETRNRSRGDRNPSNPDPPLWTLIFMGCLLINTVSFSFIPLGQISGFQVTILFLVLVVIPLLFLSLYLANKFGYGILFAGFLSIPGAAVGMIVLGDFIGVLTNRVVVEGIQVREAIYFPLAKVFEFEKPKLLLDRSVEFTDTRLVSQRPGGSGQAIPVHYVLVPIVDIDYVEGESVAAWAICASTDYSNRECFSDTSNGIRGGYQVPHNVRKIFLGGLKESRTNSQSNIQPIKTVDSPIFLYWSAGSRNKILIAGYFGIGFIIFLNFFWVGSVRIYYSLKKKH
ncbi:hypothetical protein [Leptospira sp. GIMC2001]|uniref:hypothetical protein n=1 Tax=Leptospira sp. GIMC2001 TaxID=1513297 RepID=UPI00234BD9BB|nr:hypothetical protein [Leptospira sp. GIMC2001]WCL48336.1 hypothetical protein O4O04_13605 [Leptospira sp. GIMC2001]